jgi:hypothetical protein
MTFPKPSNSDSVFMKRTVEAAIRIGVIAGLIAWCYMIARPFLAPIIWGATIAVRAKSHSSRTTFALSSVRERRLHSSMLPSLNAGTFEGGRPQIVFERGIVIEPKLRVSVRKPRSRL